MQCVATPPLLDNDLSSVIYGHPDEEHESAINLGLPGI